VPHDDHACSASRPTQSAPRSSSWASRRASAPPRYSYDTDYGGVGDGDEIWAGTTPLDSYDDYGYGGGGYDFDGDGLSDDDERYVFGTDLNLYDTDGRRLGRRRRGLVRPQPLDPSDDWY
jgi:hypothetical protein